MKITIFPGKYHQNGGFSMAMLVYRRVSFIHLQVRVLNQTPQADFSTKKMAIQAAQYSSRVPQ